MLFYDALVIIHISIQVVQICGMNIVVMPFAGIEISDESSCCESVEFLAIYIGI